MSNSEKLSVKRAIHGADKLEGKIVVIASGNVTSEIAIAVTIKINDDLSISILVFVFVFVCVQ